MLQLTFFETPSLSVHAVGEKGISTYESVMKLRNIGSI